MKLLRLKIGEPFRCLQAGFELHLLSEWDRKERAGRFDPYILAGPNGCGKSNILEVLAAIFFQLECQYLSFRPETLISPEFDEGFSDAFAGSQGIAAHRPQAFELEYLIPVPKRLQSDTAEAAVHVKISKTAGDSARVFWLNHSEHGEGKPLSRLDAWDLLPEFVLGYSSGENEILSLPFFKLRFIQLDEYLESLKENTSYSGKPESRQAFLDNAFNQAILVSNLLFQEPDTLKPFRQELGIEGLVQFRIILKKSIEISADQADTYPSEYIRVEDEAEGVKTYRLSLLQRFDAVDDERMARTAVIDRLQRCATCSYHDAETDTLYLDYIVTDETRKAFQNNFASAMDLFQYLQILLVLNLYAVSEPLKRDLYLSDSLYVNETVPTLPADARVMRFEDLVLKKSGIEDPIYARSLSDGEYQFLHCLGLCLLYRDTNSLFLLDEPETHFNPDWRSQFITRLRECFKNGDSKVLRDVLITTHTPFLISDSNPEQVLVVDKSDGIVKVTRPDYNTLGASINKITMKTFGKRETIGGHAQAILEDLRQRFEQGEDREQLIAEINHQLGDSVEKMLLIKTILDSMEGKPG